ncbi:MAG TPA: hypothetical protein VLA46_08350 [Saprospiraceae bacterium]|nr:hypothetical protein [Saprospiraceae bacterium]
MNFKINFSSFLMGCFAILCIGMLLSAIDPQPESTTGRFQSRMNESGFLILDTWSGKYILESEVGFIGNQRLIIGDFEKNFEAGRDLFSGKK